MPIYPYICDSCNKAFDHTLRVDDRDALQGVSCPACSRGSMHRIISACSFVMKGACAANGYSTNIADIEKRLGREVNNNDLPE